MFSTILIGVDGGAGGRDAIALARQLAGRDTTLVAVSVAVLHGHPEEGANRDFETDAREHAEDRLIENLRTEPGIRGEVLFGRTPAAALHAAAERFEAGLIVIGCCRRGRAGRILVGDDTRGVVLQAPCPVAVAPRDYALTARPIATVGVGWDGGVQAERALAVAQELALEHGARVHALTASSGPMWPPLSDDELGAVKIVTAEVAPGATRVPELEGVHATGATSVAAEELEHLAAEVDLLVVGSTRRGLVSRVLLGSTSQRLLSSCARPLLIVPRVREPVGERV